MFSEHSRAGANVNCSSSKDNLYKIKPDKIPAWRGGCGHGGAVDKWWVTLGRGSQVSARKQDTGSYPGSSRCLTPMRTQAALLFILGGSEQNRASEVGRGKVVGG